MHGTAPAARLEEHHGHERARGPGRFDAQFDVLFFFFFFFFFFAARFFGAAAVTHGRIGSGGGTMLVEASSVEAAVDPTESIVLRNTVVR